MIEPISTEPVERRDNRGRSRLVLALTMLLAATLLYFALRGVDWRAFLHTIQNGRYELLLVVFTAMSVNYFLRAMRWRILLGAEKVIARATVFWATLVGYLGNDFLPARAGEVIRSVMLGRKAEISISFVLATALTERIVDVVALVIISALSLMSIQGMPESITSSVRWMALLGAVGLAGVLVAPHLQGLMRAVLARLPLRENWRTALEKFLGQFLLGMRALQHPGRSAGFVGMTALIWLIDGFSAVTCASALHLSLSLWQALLLLAALGLSSAMPSTPGYVGIYQFVTVTVLAPFAISRADALAYILVLQAVNYCVVLLWGLLGLWRLTGSARPSHLRIN